MTDMSRLQGFASHAASVLEGRFYRPPLPEGHVPRWRLCQRLQEGLRGRLLLVSAPAGFGKSSLAVEFCQSLPANWQTLWLSLGGRDSDPGHFLEHLLTALQQAYPALAAQFHGLLKLRQRHSRMAFEGWLGGLLDELATLLMLSQPLLLVLDDYHLAQGPALDRHLQFIIEHAPPGLVLLVTSRQRPAWHLARLKLCRQLVELGEHELRLTEDEGRGVLASRAASMDSEALHALIQRSEGWVAGLRFWLLAVPETDDGNGVWPTLHGGEGLVRDYLLEEVIDSLPADVQAFLHDTACLERFCPALCDAVRESHDSAAMLRYLQAHQVFLVPLDGDGRWFRYHHLFSDLLRARVDAAAAPRPMRLHLNACRWLSNEGLLDEAIEQALRADQADVAANLVQNLSEEQLLAEQNVGMLLRWKMNLPDSLITSTPRLIVLYAWALGLACQLDAAEELAAHLSRFLPAPSATAQNSMLAQWLALSGIIASGRGDRKTALTYCQQALQSLPHKRYGQRLMCLSTLSNLALAAGNLSEARLLNRQALILAQQVGNPLFQGLAHYDRARVLQARGEIRRALEEVRLGLQRLRHLSRQRLYAIRARLTLYEGYLLLQALEVDAGRARLVAGIAEARACRDISVLIGQCVMAACEGCHGRFTEAFAELGEAERLMHLWGVPASYHLTMISAMKCELWLRQGRTDLAEAWLLRLSQAGGADSGGTAPECHPQLGQFLELQHAMLERICGQRDKAVPRLLALYRQAEASGARLLGLMALVQGMLTLLGTPYEAKARALLRQSLEVAAGGALLPFLPLIRGNPEWLREQLQQRPGCAVSVALLARLPGPCASRDGGDVSPLSDRLSARELSVLQLIAQGCSNQEISEQLFISLHTVKTHASHINSKLGVERRTQAVARAQELGLLS